jgi:nucleotide-binding universal stress UspA family protein
MIEKSKRQLAQATSAMIESGVNAKSILRVGNAYHGIQTIITEQKADLVVMGTEGASSISRVFVGSNTEKVVRRSWCPAISVNRNTTLESIKSIVWATSLKAEDLAIPKLLTELVNESGATVHLLRVNTPALFMTDVIVKEKLKSIAQHLKFKNFTINVFNDNDEVAGIIQFAATINADLIALSTHGRHGLSHLLKGSIAEDVINYTKMPVMTYVIGANATS